MRYDVNENHMLQEVDEQVSHYLVKLRVTDKEGFEVYNLVVEADEDIDGVLQWHVRRLLKR